MDIELADLLDVNSLQTLKLLEVNYEFIFLHVPVEMWGEDKSYKAAADKVGKINVVNDSAERGVKLPGLP